MRNLAALIVPDNDALKFTKSMIELELLQRTGREIIVLTEPNLLLSSIRHLEFINIICESLLSIELKWISIRQKLGRFSIIIFNIYQIAAAYMEMGIKVDWSKHHKNCMIGGSKIRLFVIIVHKLTISHLLPDSNVAKGSRQTA